MKDARTLLPYQQRWVAETSGLAAIQKSRRIGISWAEAYNAVMHAGLGRGDVYYQSYSLDMARGFVADCAEWVEHCQGIAIETAGETLIDTGDSHAVQAFRLRLAAGKTITALASSPRAWRSKGRPGDIAVIDEAAFIDDLEAVLTAALATRMWGGAVRVISTHNGEANPFAALCRDIAERRQPGALHTVTLADALHEGLYKRICMVTGQHWSGAAEAAWEAGLRAEYGARAAQELDCVPSAGSGAWLAWKAITDAEDAEAGKAELYAGGTTYIGVDVARRRDLWVAAVIEKVGDVLWLREIQTARDISFSEQRAIVRTLAARYRPLRIAVDQTGMGEAVVEQLAEDHGGLTVEGVLMTTPKRLDVATALREAFEDNRIRIPADEALRRDLHSLRAEAGPTGAPRLTAERADTDGHGDRFWALALACAAAAQARGPFEAWTTDRRHAAFRAPDGLGPGSGHEIDYELGVVRSPLSALNGW